METPFFQFLNSMLFFAEVFKFGNIEKAKRDVVLKNDYSSFNIC